MNAQSAQAEQSVNPRKIFFDRIAFERGNWKSKNAYYHDAVERFVAENVQNAASVLEIGCGPGDLLAKLKAGRRLGVDFSEAMILEARRNYPGVDFITAEAEDLPLKECFDCVILSDTIGLLPDVQKVFEEVRRVLDPKGRVVITYYNFLWEPLLDLAEKLGFKMPQPAQNWLPLEDIRNLLHLAGFEVIKKGYRLLLPVKIPLLSTLCNRFLAKLPLIEKLCLVEWLIAKPISEPRDPNSVRVSVIIPCRNERDNIEPAVRRTPGFGEACELIFVDGNSTDGTLEEIARMQAEFPERAIRLVRQGTPKGKCDAVQKGFEAAQGELLMILDADLTVPPEDLPKFFSAIVQGKGEFINGTRLVYPMEKQAMRFLNLLGNKFFGMAFSYLLEQRFSDTLCGTKVLWKRDYEKIKAGRAYFGDFDPFGDFDLIFGAARQNLKIIELPVRYRERVYGVTKIRRFTHGWLLLKMCWVAARKIKFV